MCFRSLPGGTTFALPIHDAFSVGVGVVSIRNVTLTMDGHHFGSTFFLLLRPAGAINEEVGYDKDEGSKTNRDGDGSKGDGHTETAKLEP